MQPNFMEIAERIRALREIMDISVEEMAGVTGVSSEEYERLEAGQDDFTFTFLYKCAERFGVDLIELVSGEEPHLLGCSVVRAGQGLPIKRRQGFKYEHLAATFQNKIAEPFVVTAPFIEAEQDAPITLSTHEGQEMDYILSGSLKFVHNGHTYILNEGDSAYYDSSKGHGMIAVGGAPCTFISIVMKKAD